jgi:hypothetical protein
MAEMDRPHKAESEFEEVSEPSDEDFQHRHIYPHRRARVHLSRPFHPPSPPYPPYPPFAPYPPYPPYPPNPAALIQGSCCRCGGTTRPTATGSSMPASAGGASSTAPSPAGGPSSSSASSSGSTASPSSSGATSSFAVSQLSLPPYSGLYQGTGTFPDNRTVVDPITVPGSAKMNFVTQSLGLTTLFFQISSSVVPNRFGVAVPSNSKNFDRPNLFFHPIPAQAGYKDSDYPSAGMWPQLFYYMERLGYQVDAAINHWGGGANDQIVIMPYLTSSAVTSWILPANWYGILTNILSQTKAAMGLTGAVTMKDLVLSSFSAGFFYLNNFRQSAPGLKSLLKEIWVFDGYPQASAASLKTTSDYTVRKYDEGADPTAISAPTGRWANFPNPPPNKNDPTPWDPSSSKFDDTHHLIRDFLFLHAANNFK